MANPISEGAALYLSRHHGGRTSDASTSHRGANADSASRGVGLHDSGLGSSIDPRGHLKSVLNRLSITSSIDHHQDESSEDSSGDDDTFHLLPGRHRHRHRHRHHISWPYHRRSQQQQQQETVAGRSAETAAPSSFPSGTNNDEPQQQQQSNEGTRQETATSSYLIPDDEDDRLPYVNDLTRTTTKEQQQQEADNFFTHPFKRDLDQEEVEEEQEPVQPPYITPKTRLTRIAVPEQQAGPSLAVPSLGAVNEGEVEQPEGSSVPTEEDETTGGPRNQWGKTVDKIKMINNMQTLPEQNGRDVYMIPSVKTSLAPFYPPVFEPSFIAFSSDEYGRKLVSKTQKAKKKVTCFFYVDIPIFTNLYSSGLFYYLFMIYFYYIHSRPFYYP